MKKFIPTLLSTAIAVISSGSAFADNATMYSGKVSSPPPLPTPSYHYAKTYQYAKMVPIDPLHFKGTMTDAENWDGFFQGSHLATWWRAAYFNYDYKHANKSIGATGYAKPDWKQAAAGAMIDWMSGYADGWFGINASFYGGLKLDATGPGPTDWLIRKNNAGEYRNSFGRIGRFNAKFRLGGNVNNVLIHAGLVGADPEYLQSTLLAPEPHKITLTTERGVTVKSNLCHLQLYGAYWDKIAGRTQNGLEHFTNGNGKTIDYVGGFGAKYTFPLDKAGQKLMLNAEYAEGKNYLKEYMGQATYTLPLSDRSSMVVNGQYYKVEKAGNLWSSGAYANTFDKSAHLTNLNLAFTIDRLTLGAAYTKTKAKSTNGTGIASNHFYYSPAANYSPSGYFGTSRQESDFDFDGENAYQLGVSYDMSDFAPGLSVGVTHTYGNNINKKVGLKNENETDVAVTYHIPKVQGLWVDIEEAYYNSKSDNNTYARNQGQRYNDFRVWLNYQVAMF